MLLYIHGLASCGQGAKARLLVEHFGRDRVLTPDLPLEPDSAVAALESLIDNRRDLLLVGSSLGGYYAAWLAPRHELPAVLINPAVAPWESLAPLVGTVRHWCTGEPLQWTLSDVEQLHRYQPSEPPAPGRFLVLLQTGDETLDYRLAARRFAACEPLIEQGGSHAFDRFPEHFDRIEAFHRRTLGPLRG